MANELRELRLAYQIPAIEMVNVVKEIHPKYGKSEQSKCENSEAYGICLCPDAMEALYKRFAPERLAPPKKTRHGQHRLTCRISARLENADYAALQRLIAADGYTTMQDWLTAMVRERIREAGMKNEP